MELFLLPLTTRPEGWNYDKQPLGQTVMRGVHEGEHRSFGTMADKSPMIESGTSPP